MRQHGDLADPAPPLSPCRNRGGDQHSTLEATLQISDGRLNAAIATRKTRCAHSGPLAVPTAISTVVTAMV